MNESASSKVLKWGDKKMGLEAFYLNSVKLDYQTVKLASDFLMVASLHCASGQTLRTAETKECTLKQIMYSG